jgi:predicted  nucleic acid-binding Zn-ribbon protein
LSAIDKLKDKINLLKDAYQKMKIENRALKKRVIELEERLVKYQESDFKEVTTLKNLLKEKEKKIKELQQDMLDKDAEIEAIISKVETLLGELGDY